MSQFSLFTLHQIRLEKNLHFFIKAFSVHLIYYIITCILPRELYELVSRFTAAIIYM